MNLTKYDINPNIRFIQRGWVSSNSILIAGDRPAIIDTGHYMLANQLPPLIKAEGVDPATLTKIVNTHCHWDHHTGNAALKQLCHAPVYMGELTARWMRERNSHETWMSYFGVTPVFSDPDHTIAAGDVLEIGGFDWDVIALPGHAPDLLGFYQPQERVLVCADAMLPNGDMGVLNVMVHGWEALDQAEASLEKMLNMDIRVALPGHGPIITFAESNLLALRQRLIRFRDDPQRLVRHFTRRITMAFLLETEPLTYEAAVQAALSFPWIVDYEPLFGVSAEKMLTKTIDELIQGRALKIVDGKLISRVRR